MLNAKAAYAQGRQHVDANFVALIARCLGQVDSPETLRNFKLFFEAFLGLLQAGTAPRANKETKRCNLPTSARSSGQIELVSGLHIGSGNAEMHIGGTDNPVIKNPVTNQPYIPGSSLKGKMRSLLEWRAGVVGVAEGKPLGFKHLGKLSGDAAAQGRTILKLFGGAPEGTGRDDALAVPSGPPAWPSGTAGSIPSGSRR